MKIKKLLTVALAGVMATAAFAGCSTKENEGSNVANDNKTYTIGVLQTVQHPAIYYET